MRRVEQDARRNGRRGRRVESRALRRRILIVCEGTATEPSYFEAFPVASAHVQVVGTGDNTQALVREAERQRRRLHAEGKDFDEVWVVFDKDDYVSTQFDAAVADVVALSEPQRPWDAAWANRCFELWLLLHFDFVDSDLDQAQLASKLGERMRGYRKNDVNLYKRLLADQPCALKHADKLERGDSGHPPSACAPGTTVHRLVRTLNAEMGP